MAGDSLDIELLLQVLEQEIRAIRQDTRLGQPTGTRGAALISHIQDLLDAVTLRIGRNPGLTASSSARAAFARELRQSAIMVRTARAALPLVETTRRPRINMGSLYLAEELARVIVAPGVDLVVIPNRQYMYSTSSWPFAPVIRGTRGFTQKTSRRPILLNYPLTDDDRLLLHPILAHELGHASCDEHGLVDVVARRYSSDSGFTAELTKVVATLATSAGVGNAQVKTAVLKILYKWIEELICDHLALESVGPAFLWAFAVFALPISYSEPGPDHPPNTLRIKLALKHLSRRGWRAFLSRVAPGVTSWLNDVGNDVPTPPVPIQDAFLTSALTRHAGWFTDVAVGRVGSERLDPRSAGPSSEQAVELLRRRMLPLGVEDPLPPRSILLGAWVEAIRRYSDTPSGCAKALEDTSLQELVGKAMELSVVASAWKSCS